jgi:hypothetical protein
VPNRPTCPVEASTKFQLVINLKNSAHAGHHRATNTLNRGAELIGYGHFVPHIIALAQDRYCAMAQGRRFRQCRNRVFLGVS